MSLSARVVSIEQTFEFVRYPGFVFHNDIETAHMATTGTKVLVDGVACEVVSYSYNGNGELTYILRKLKKNGMQMKHGVRFVEADDFPEELKSDVTVRIIRHN